MASIILKPNQDRCIFKQLLPDMAYHKSIRGLVKIRLMNTPSNIKIPIGGFGEFSRDQLIEEVGRGTAAGNAAIRMELLFIRKMASISRRIQESDLDPASPVAA